MTNQPYCYWKYPDQPVNGVTGGYRGVDTLPEGAITREVPLPKALEISEDDSGELTIISPPVFGQKRACRYELRLNAHVRANLPKMSDNAIDCLFNTYAVEAPEKDVTRENWWWYAKDRFTLLGYSQKTPVGLMKKWKKPILEILLEGHPEREQILDRWAARISSHTSYMAGKRKKVTKAHRKHDGDLVVLPRPLAFNGYGMKQVFRYHIEPASFGRRAKHSLRIGSTRFKAAHSQAMSLSDGLPEDNELSLPMQVACLLLSWGHAKMPSTHAIVRAEARFAERTARAIVILEKELVAAIDGDAPYFTDKLLAAENALIDFMPPRADADAPPRRKFAAERVEAEITRALEIMRAAREKLDAESA